MNFEDLAKTSGEWLRGSGPESDIVISSRIRLARNLADFPFIARATDSDKAEIESILRGRVEALRESGKLGGSRVILMSVSWMMSIANSWLNDS